MVIRYFLFGAFVALAICTGTISTAMIRDACAVDPQSDRNGGSSRRELNLPPAPYQYSRLDLPPRVQAVIRRFDNTPTDNPLTDEGATLGRVLFYDRTLSANGTTSCATCHVQQYAFSEPRAKSVGFRGEAVNRNSMSLVNLRFYARDKFFWDERASTLENQVLMPIENPIEMGHRIDVLVDQLSHDPIYPPLVEKAFGDRRVTRTRIAKALAQFVRSIVSFQSRYDVGLRQVDSPLDDFPNFTDQENLGKRQFFGRARCAECHLPGHGDGDGQQWFIFQLPEPGNNGIDMDDPRADLGVASHTDRIKDEGKFKPSTLRNIELTFPYMHDGRFQTIDQVIEHYNWSVRPHRNLDPRLEDFAANGLALPEVPKVALAAFLETLTDTTLINDPKYSDPFVRAEDVIEKAAEH